MKFALSALALFAASVSAQDTVVDVAVESAAHTTLVSLVTQARLVETLSGAGPFTVFAPVNDAFAAVPTKYTEDAYAPHLSNLLTYHVAAGTVLSTDLTAGPITMLSGDNVTVALDPITLNGDTSVTAADSTAGNGVVHVIDKVLLPPWVSANVVETAQSVDALSTLVDLVVAADLAGALSAEGPFTVFAPVNDAFAALPAEEVTRLTTTPEGLEDLANIIQYHAITGIVTSADLAAGDVTMLNGDMATVAGNAEDGWTIAGVPITTADILVNNGIVHLVSAVMLPPADGGDDHDSHDGGDHDSHDDEESSAVAKASTVGLVSAAVAYLLL